MSSDGRGSYRRPSFPRRLQLGGLISGSDYGLSASPGYGTLTRFASGETPGHRGSSYGSRGHDYLVTAASGGRRSMRDEIEPEGSHPRQSCSIESHEGSTADGHHGSRQTPREQRGLLQFGWPASVPSSTSLGSWRSPSVSSSHLQKQLEQDRRMMLDSGGTLEEEPRDDVNLEGNGLKRPLLSANGKPSKAGRARRVRIDSIVRALVYGLINAIVSAPTMVSYGAVVFENNNFKPFMGQLVKQVFLASAIDQTVTVFRSSLPAAIGQVQDVGLIFLSTMASSIMSSAIEKNMKPEEALGATLVTLSLSTLIVGLLVTTTGYLKLAGLVQYVPLPVVGGYLGYVGFFCVLAGAFLSADVEKTSWRSYLELFSTANGWNSSLVKLSAGVACAAILYLVLIKIPHPAALPTTLFAIPLVFFAVMMGCGFTLEDAKAAGWVASTTASNNARFWEIWKLFDLGGISSARGLIVQQIPTIIVLCVMVAFGSSMDIAAVQQEFEGELDYNKELVNVGIANILCGSMGAGYTGSLIFSQTIFNIRSGVDSRVNGIVVALVEYVLFAVPFSPVNYLPNFFFGALTIWIGVDILLDWLVISYTKVTLMEYGLLWITFIGVVALGLGKGLILGVVASLLHFAISYAKVNITAYSVLPSRGCYLRPFAQRSILELFSGNVMAVSLSGYIFFGSSVKINKKVLALVEGMVKNSETDGGISSANSPNLRPAKALENGIVGLGSRKAFRIECAVNSAPKFLLLDFQRVHGIDATAARSFSTLCKKLQMIGVEAFITHLPSTRPGVRRLLVAHGVIGDNAIFEAATINGEQVEEPPTVRSFDSMEEGLSFCEEHFLEIAVAHGLLAPPASSMQLAEILKSSLSLPKGYIPDDMDFKSAANALRSFLTVKEMKVGERLFSIGGKATELCIVEKGKIAVEIDLMRIGHPCLPDMNVPDKLSVPSKLRVLGVGPGGVVGEMDFLLRRPRSCYAFCVEDSRLLCLSHEAVEKMAILAPRMLNLIQAVLLRSTSMSLSHALQTLERAGRLQ
ncbi:unnamed protein product [Ostreobium quekettii]|uniref:Uncharacterized protein n=1 Tax=Ostreobium quekettii TaxID=121088 RepID=A0A8S1J384_9CHLO|nr:unnamed protein product [Ostreobium quekettii]|eukprot:evm.model.scf_791.5 EVM.evm.TU.scf_791.5   scf_791:46078-59115(-)